MKSPVRLFPLLKQHTIAGKGGDAVADPRNIALQQQMDSLEDTSLVGGERADATDHCLAGIVRLSNEVKDAASYIPTYDQRVYAEVYI